MLEKKILYVVNVDWFFISHRLPIALEALKKGYKVYIACGITDKHQYLLDLGFYVYPLRLDRGSKGISSQFNSIYDIYRVLQEVKPDIVHFVTIKPVLFGGIVSLFFSNIKKRVFSISGLGYIFISEGLKYSLVRFVIKILYKIALSGKGTVVIVQNNDDKKIILSISHVPVVLIKGSGVDLKKYKFIPERLTPVKVVMATRLLKDKGVYEYLKSAKIIKNSGYDDVVFELYGDIDLDNPASIREKELEQLKSDFPVQIKGFSNDISKVFSESNIVVLPSYREGLPKVLIEAAACGRAVVTTDVPGCRDAIKVNQTGLLVKVKDVQSLVKQIIFLIEHKDKRLQMAKNAREYACRKFDINKVIEQHFWIYER